MRGLAIVLALSLAAVAPRAEAHTMPNSTVVVLAQSGRVTLSVSIPVSELAAASGRDAVDRAETGDYLAAHVAVIGADGRAWTSTIVSLRADDGDHPALAAMLAFAPTEGGSSRATSLRYDAVTHRIASHHVLVYRCVGEALVPLGRLQAPATTLRLP